MARPNAAAPHDGGDSSSSAACFGAGSAPGDLLRQLQQQQRQRQQQNYLDIFDYLSSDDQAGPPAAMPGAFVPPPPMDTPAEPAVPGAPAGCYPHPRNYYRCSTEGCKVKKRVERDRNDPSYVVTTYEGIHNHVSPGTVYYAAQDAASGRFFVAAGMQHPELN
ncbi:hypothetical protein GUJ93_ZPchr0007g5795 [Zizania palustris]|uniref:WRKY domain-containing protein n=1 Tax=Zizania palustris TaxID=103762 RepID=A0A8J5TE74_ZIZPA|nr:hypothetical protein GUJ93_ZPchr0007g5795 [Zizania palustris]